MEILICNVKEDTEFLEDDKSEDGEDLEEEENEDPDKSESHFELREQSESNFGAPKNRPYRR